MPLTMEYVVACLAGYLLGSVPVALLVARRHGVDLHAVGAAARSFAGGARAGVFGFPFLQAALYPLEQVAATGGLMAIIGALFALRSRSAPARSASDAAPTG